MAKILAVMIGCAFGGAFRFLITTYVNKLGHFPYGTLTVNLIGCFLIGIISTLLTERFTGVSPYLSLLLTVGFLGGLTTFSSFGNETMLLLKTGLVMQAMLNVALNTLGGLLAVWLGIMLVRIIYS
ncbi:MAG TPA: fluoride efflux transporter CrcB [Megamonas hypermegale]|uniref:Fluoride-specific ion channel FluC n=1 Tax=Megamonas hypermegale TaxID=158847 RepID=A0A921L7M3_9FIRM|nr:fluoride efflux transporter CrcB [Megamonas hypermegale]MDM8144311.1 fluoride efflux transporter CrcB [Megamonas hypermegale]HJF85050.1 fluoride efflux transporter CrcB [Megamonas hypermegale]